MSAVVHHDEALILNITRDVMSCHIFSHFSQRWLFHSGRLVCSEWNEIISQLRLDLSFRANDHTLSFPLHFNALSECFSRGLFDNVQSCTITYCVNSITEMKVSSDNVTKLISLLSNRVQNLQKLCIHIQHQQDTILERY